MECGRWQRNGLRIVQVRDDVELVGGKEGQGAGSGGTRPPLQWLSEREGGRRASGRPTHAESLVQEDEAAFEEGDGLHAARHLAGEELGSGKAPSGDVVPEKCRCGGRASARRDAVPRCHGCTHIRSVPSCSTTTSSSRSVHAIPTVVSVSNSCQSTPTSCGGKRDDKPSPVRRPSARSPTSRPFEAKMRRWHGAVTWRLASIKLEELRKRAIGPAPPTGSVDTAATVAPSGRPHLRSARLQHGSP